MDTEVEGAKSVWKDALKKLDGGDVTFTGSSANIPRNVADLDCNQGSEETTEKEEPDKKKVKVFVVGNIRQAMNIEEPFGKVKISANVFATPVTGNDYSAWDYCAAESLCDQVDSFLWVNTSQQAKDSVEIVTATGSSGCEGRGPIVKYLHHSKDHGSYILIVLNGILSPITENSPMSITSALQMEKLGLCMKIGQPKRSRQLEP